MVYKPTNISRGGPILHECLNQKSRIPEMVPNIHSEIILHEVGVPFPDENLGCGRLYTIQMEVSINGVTLIAGWFMENPIQVDDLRVPLWTPPYSYIQFKVVVFGNCDPHHVFVEALHILTC